jgi:hypothetical protein
MIETRYKITSVEDFFAVPANKIDHCLTDFRLWIEAIREYQDTLGGLATPDPNNFTWIDDGKHDKHVRLTLPEDR